MEEIIYLVVLVFGVLQIILFFKIWGMTNNIRKITGDVGFVAQYAEKMLNMQRIDGANDNDSIFEEGDLVVDGEENQWRIIEIDGISITCKNSTKGVQKFYADDLKPFKGI